MLNGRNQDPPAVGRSNGQLASTTESLAFLRGVLGATSLTLVSFDDDKDSFEVVASAGSRGLRLAPGVPPAMTLPIEASALTHAGGEGCRAHVSLERSGQPLDELAASLGLRCGFSIPLTAMDALLGALIVLWDVEPPPVEDPAAAVVGSEAALLRPLVAAAIPAPRVLVCYEAGLPALGLQSMAERLGAEVEIASTLTTAVRSVTVAPSDLIVLSDHLSPDEQLPEIAHRLRVAGAAAPLLVVARAATAHSFENAIRAGAAGYLPHVAGKRFHFEETASALLDGRSVLPGPDTVTQCPTLTTREHEILRRFERGLSDKEIAFEFGIAVSTVKTHTRRILRKFDATSRWSALHKARSLGLP